MLRADMSTEDVGEIFYQCVSAVKKVRLRGRIIVPIAVVPGFLNFNFLAVKIRGQRRTLALLHNDSTLSAGFFTALLGESTISVRCTFRLQAAVR
jgi:hypothetical protein